MKIVINIRENKITLKTKIRGQKIKFGYIEEESGIYSPTGMNIEDLAEFLNDNEIEALEDIDLTTLLKEFQDEAEEGYYECNGNCYRDDKCNQCRG